VRGTKLFEHAIVPQEFWRRVERDLPHFFKALSSGPPARQYRWRLGLIQSAWQCDACKNDYQLRPKPLATTSRTGTIYDV